MTSAEQLDEFLANTLEANGDALGAGVVRDYPKATEYFGVSASYIGPELGPLVDEIFGRADRWPCSASWLGERALVAVWRAMGRPTK